MFNPIFKSFGGGGGGETCIPNGHFQFVAKSLSDRQSISPYDSQSDSQSSGNSDSQSVRKSDSYSLQSVSHLISPSVRKSVIQSVSKTVSQSAKVLQYLSLMHAYLSKMDSSLKQTTDSVILM